MGLRERYVHGGPEPLGDAELLALVLGTGTVGVPALGVAQDLLGRFGDLRGLLSAEPAELAAVHGLGSVRAIKVHAALQLGLRARRPRAERPIVTRAEQAHAVLAPSFVGLEDEQLHGLFLGRRGQLLAHRVLTRGCASFTIVDGRQIFRTAVRLGAASVILAHNHPSGDPEPSRADLDVTAQVARAGRVIGVPLVDHLVITERCWTSLAARGHLPRPAADNPIWTP